MTKKPKKPKKPKVLKFAWKQTPAKPRKRTKPQKSVLDNPQPSPPVPTYTTLELLELGVYNFTRPADMILREFGDVLVELSQRIQDTIHDISVERERWDR
jgi:hypothetical protein